MQEAQSEKIDIRLVPFAKWKTDIDGFIEPFIQEGKIDQDFLISQQLRPEARMAFIALGAVEGLEPGVIKSGPRSDGQEVIERLDGSKQRGRFYAALELLSTPISKYTFIDCENTKKIAEVLTLIATCLSWKDYYDRVARERAKEGKETPCPFWDLLSGERVTAKETMADLPINDPRIDEGLSASEIRGIISPPDTRTVWDRAGLLSIDELRDTTKYRQDIESRARIAARLMVASEEVMSSTELRESEEYGDLRAGRFYQDVSKFVEEWIRPLET